MLLKVSDADRKIVFGAPPEDFIEINSRVVYLNGYYPRSV